MSSSLHAVSSRSVLLLLLLWTVSSCPFCPLASLRRTTGDQRVERKTNESICPQLLYGFATDWLMGHTHQAASGPTISHIIGPVNITSDIKVVKTVDLFHS